MTITNPTIRLSTNGDGVTAVYPVSFPFYEETDLVIVLIAADDTETIQTLTTHYTVTGGEGSTGSITMVTAPAAGERLVRYRVSPLTQETDYAEGDAFPADSHEAALDRLTMQNQEQADKLDRSLSLSETSEVTGNVSIEEPIAGRPLKWNATGDGIENGSTNLETIETNVAADAAQVVLDKIATAADVVSTNADASSTAADALQTSADRVQTGLDRVATTADAVSTAADAVTTAGHATTTTNNAASTAADAVSTAADAVTTAGNASTTTTNAINTAVDAIATAADVVSSADNAGSASTSAVNAAASAAAAAASAASNLYSTIAHVSGTVSPNIVTDDGTLYVCDTASAVTINLPAIGTSEGARFGFINAGGANSVTINRNGTDTINGGTSLTLSDDTQFVTVISDDNTPDNWITLSGSSIVAGDGIIKTGETLSTDPAVTSLIPQNSQSSAYTCVLADVGQHIFHPSADTTARIWTIPANSSVAYPIGTALTFINDNGAGVITIAITSDTLRWAGDGSTGSRTLAANGMVTAVKITSTSWMIGGSGLT